jgi:hypothetical protein
MRSHAVIGCCGWLCRHIVKDVRRPGGTSPPNRNEFLALADEFLKHPVINDDIKETVDRIVTGLYFLPRIGTYPTGNGIAQRERTENGVYRGRGGLFQA